MTRIQTRISHVHPTASIHQRGTLLRLGYCGVLRSSMVLLFRPSAGWARSSAGSLLLDLRVVRAASIHRSMVASLRVTRIRVRHNMAGGGGGSGQTTSILNAGGAFTNRMTAETLRVRADIACVIQICTWAVTTTRKWY
jgi:hypothetical protein